MEKFEKASAQDLERLFDEACRKGAVLSLFHFDAHGSSEDEVSGVMVDFIGRMTNERGILYCKGEIEPPLEKEGKWSTIAEVKVLSNNLSALLNLAFKYSPIAVEMLKPNEIRLTLEEAQSLVLDASGTAQEYAQYVLEKTMTGDDLKRFRERMKWRAERGREILEKAKREG